MLDLSKLLSTDLLPENVSSNCAGVPFCSDRSTFLIQVFLQWAELFNKEAALAGTPLDASRELFNLSLQQFHSAHAFAGDVREPSLIFEKLPAYPFMKRADILLFWGDTLIDLASVTPVSSPHRAILESLAKQKYASAKQLGASLAQNIPSSGASNSIPTGQISARPSIFDELRQQDITWDNFYSDDDDTGHNYANDDDKMDVS